MEQLILHLIGDYLTQSDWMAKNKTRASFPAFVHALFYSLPFLWLTTHIPAIVCIFATHFLIDRFRLARYVCWAKNFLAPRGSNLPWIFCSATGYDNERPQWMAVWLLIIADNTLHLAINYAVLRWL